MKFNINILRPLILSTTFVFYLTGCKQNKEGLSVPFQNGVYKDHPDKDLLSNYLLASNTFISNEDKVSQEVKIYVDKSSGINEAFTSPVGGKLASDQLIKVLAYYNSSKYIGVLNEIKELDLKGQAPVNYFSNGNNYDPVAIANLRAAFKEISNQNALSFLISDCEEFDDTRMEIIKDPWAKDYLIKWLDKGNSIHFWVTDFQKNGKTKHLFFIAFAPSQILSTDNNNSFSNLVKDLNNLNSNHFELSNKNWMIQKPSWTQTTTGLDPNLLVKGVFNQDNYIRDLSSTPIGYEYIEISYPIKKEVLKSERALKSSNFYRGLKVDLSNNRFFDIDKIDLGVYEISNDLENYAKYFQISKNNPQYITNEKGAKVLDPNNPYSSFYNENGKIKEENRYKCSIEYKKLNELFSLDLELFNNTRNSDPSNSELAFNIHPNFNENDPILKNEKKYNLIRVDFKVKGFNEKTPDLNMFKWASIINKNSGTENLGLLESIKQAINATKPFGKVIHTIYIKFIRE